MRPLVVVDRAPTALADALADVRAAGWAVVTAWRDARDGVVCTGTVRSPEDAAAALLAAVSGAGLVVAVEAERELVERLCDDLRRFGRVEYRSGATPRAPRLAADERALLELLRAGNTLGEAARQLNLSRRTADRRLASARRTLGVRTTAEAIVSLVARAGPPSRVRDGDA